jgi:hypothetical protein
MPVPNNQVFVRRVAPGMKTWLHDFPVSGGTRAGIQVPSPAAARLVNLTVSAIRKMKVVNIHKREINRPKDEVLGLFATLSQKGDRIWPFEKWPAMKFKNGLRVNSAGGHGPVRYKVIDYRSTGYIEFEFLKPRGFKGIHKLEITDLNDNKTGIEHTIEMETSGFGTLSWIFAIRWLHDALLEDALDKIENQLCNEERKSEWNLWVKTLRRIMKPKKKSS